MSSRTPQGSKPNLPANRAPERRRTRRNEPAARAGKAFYRPRQSVAAADTADPDFVPGYN